MMSILKKILKKNEETPVSEEQTVPDKIKQEEIQKEEPAPAVQDKKDRKIFDITKNGTLCRHVPDENARNGYREEELHYKEDARRTIASKYILLWDANKPIDSRNVVVAWRDKEGNLQNRMQVSELQEYNAPNLSYYVHAAMDYIRENPAMRDSASLMLDRSVGEFLGDVPQEKIDEFYRNFYPNGIEQ